MCKADLDDVFAYQTQRFVRIRDRRLGLTFLGAQIAIAVYTIIYTIILNQAYMAKQDVTGSARMQLRRPDPEYRWGDGAAPYCIGGNANGTAAYAFPTAGQYVYVETTMPAVVAPQAGCKYLDARYAVPNGMETSAVFLPSRTTVIHEVVSPLPDCVDLGHSYCRWTTNSSILFYTVDVEMFTLLIDHSFMTDKGHGRGQPEMTGVLLDTTGRTVDPCKAYDRFPSAGCPKSVVSIGAGAAQRDIVALRSLLHAADIASLDEAGGVTTSLRNETKRYAGIVMYVKIDYFNYYGPGSCVGRGTGSFEASNVQYVIRASVVSETEFKSEEVISNGEYPAPQRTVYNRHGVRIIVTQGGCIGLFDFQTLLVNLTVSLGLLSVAAAITNFLAFQACPLRHVYKQYAFRTTVDFSDVRDVATTETLDRFRTDPYALQPVPAVFQQMFDEQQRRKEERRKVLAEARIHDLERFAVRTLHK